MQQAKQLAASSNKSAGFHSLVALLLGLEAQRFVITIGSNWGRLINEVRSTYVPNSTAHLL